MQNDVVSMLSLSKASSSIMVIQLLGGILPVKKRSYSEGLKVSQDRIFSTSRLQNALCSSGPREEIGSLGTTQQRNVLRK